MKLIDNNKSLITLLFFAFFLVGCSPTLPPVQPTAIIQPSPSLTIFPTQTTRGKTETRPVATSTPSPEPSFTPSITPSSAPLFTPTSNFKITPQIRLTPVAPAVCPPISMGKISLPDKLPENETDFENTILDLLNSGGIEQLMSHYKQGNMTYKDVTNDQVKELIISGLYPRPSLFVFGCKDGQFIDLLKIPPGEEGNPEVLAIKDMNKDGKLELVIDMLACRYCKGAQIYEWNGESFDSLVKSWYFDDIVTNSIQFNDIADFAGSTDISIADIDHDGFDELVLDGGTPSGLAAMSGWEGPWRKQKMIYKWNGQAYVWFSQLYYPPKFRFEAIQDGDIQTARGDYDDAIKSYQAAIFETDLKSWDFDIWHNLVVENDEKRIFGYPDLKTMPFNQKEYQQLSSYARYRMFLIYLKREWMSDARTIFTTMQEKFPQGDPGYPYLQMATIFWEEYQSSHDLNQSCSKVIEFIKENKDTLDPLNSGSLWEKTYYPEDVCPYR